MSNKSITDFPDAPDIESSTLDYAGRFAGPVGQWLLDQQIDATRRALQQIDGGKPLTILDVGGAHGQNIALARELGHSITVFASDPDSTEVIQPQIDAGNVIFETGSLLELPYKDNSFDVVICYRILSHMASWPQLAAELARVSADVVLVDYPCKKSVNFIADLLFVLKKRIEKNTRRYGCFYDSQIDDVFAKSNCSQWYRHKQFFVPMAFDRMLGKVAISKMMAGFFRGIGLTDRFGSPVISGYRKQPEL